MKKSNIIFFIIGAIIFGTISAFATQYIVTYNPYPVKLNGQNIAIEGYNINDNTYFKLRDVADAIGYFTVDFNNSTIQIAKDGYVYNNEKIINDTKKFIGRWIYSGEDRLGYTIDIEEDGTACRTSYHNVEGGTYFVSENDLIIYLTVKTNDAPITHTLKFTYQPDGTLYSASDGNILTKTEF